MVCVFEVSVFETPLSKAATALTLFVDFSRLQMFVRSSLETANWYFFFLSQSKTDSQRQN